jgi:glycosyltransferase involved in cell wall biosynthesis
LHKLRDWSSKSALKKASANVFESRYVLEAARRRYSVSINKPEVIYIGVDDRSLVADDLENRQTVQPMIVVVTSPQPHKRNELLVPILAELRKRAATVDWRIKIFGGLGPDVWQDLKATAQEHGVLDYIEFMGYRTREEVNSALDSAACLLSTSAVESFCMVALEAMARGCPVIVSDDAAMPESVGEDGFVVDSLDSSAVADVAKQLFNDATFRLEYSRKGIRRARTMTWSDSGSQFADLANSLIP